MTTDAALDRKLFAAVERLARALGAHRRRVATRHGLSLLGVGAVEALADGRTRQVGALAAELDVSQPTISDAVATLRRRGLVAQRQDPDDRRRSLVSLTGEGEALARAIARAMAPTLRTDATGRPDAGERAGALRLVLGEIARLQEAGIISVSRTCTTCHHYRPLAGSHEARCLLLDAPLRDADLRVDCDEHEPRRA